MRVVTCSAIRFLTIVSCDCVVDVFFNVGVRMFLCIILDLIRFFNFFGKVVMKFIFDVNIMFTLFVL